MAFTGVTTIPGTTHTVTDADDGYLLLFTNSGPITVTCPGTTSEGVEIVCVQAGDGQITFITSGLGNILNPIIPTTRSKRSYVAIALESTGNFMFNGKMGNDKVLVTSNYAALAAPLVTDDDSKGYSAGSLWVYGTTAYLCVDASTGAAVWQFFTFDGASLLYVNTERTTDLVSTSVTLFNSHSGQTLYIAAGAPVTVTINTGLQSGFNCRVIQDDALSVITLAGTATLKHAVPTVIDGDELIISARVTPGNYNIKLI